MPELRAYVNGELIPEGEATISVYDSGLNFGDAVFEGIRVYNGRVFKLDEHLRRLYGSAKAVDIDIPLSPSAFRSEILGWLRANEIMDNFHFRPIVTRGNRFPPRVDPRFVTSQPNVIIVGGPIGSPPVDGVRAVIARTRRIPPDCLDSKIKSANFLNNILAKLEAIRQGVDDALVLDVHGFLAEGATSNVFLVRDGALLTPWAKSCLDGITRGVVMELALHAGYSVAERDLTTTDIYTADELFLSGTGAEITPVIEVDGKPIGEGKTGPVALQIMELLRAHVRSSGVSIAEDMSVSARQR